jgi:hypothetical protein
MCQIDEYIYSNIESVLKNFLIWEIYPNSQNTFVIP